MLEQLLVAGLRIELRWVKTGMGVGKRRRLACEIEVVEVVEAFESESAVVGAYRERRNADEMARQLEARGEPVRKVEGDDGIVRVLVGPYETEARTRLVLERYGGMLRPCRD